MSGQTCEEGTRADTDFSGKRATEKCESILGIHRGRGYGLG